MAVADRLPPNLAAAAAAIANARAGRRGAPLVTNVLDLLSGDLLAEVVADARAVMTALAALPPQPRPAGPLAAADAQALRLDLGAELVAIVAWPAEGPVRVASSNSGNRSGAGELDPEAADRVAELLAAAIRPVSPASSEPRS